VGLIAGSIEKGDYARFKAFLSEHYRDMSEIHLVSRGGDAEEAIKIGRLLRQVSPPRYRADDAQREPFCRLGVPTVELASSVQGPKLRLRDCMRADLVRHS
jgi:hypothetical protein